MKEKYSQPLEALVEKYSDRGEFMSIGMGLRPSGVIHLGNMATMALGGILANKIGPHLSDIQITVCDLDMPDRRDWSIEENGYVRYFGDLRDREKCHKSLLEHCMEGLQEFSGGIEEVLGVRSSIRTLSDIQKDPDFRTALKKVVEERNLMKYLLPQLGEDKFLLFPICSECKTSSGYPSKYSKGIIYNKCGNDDCDVDKIEVDILDTTKDVAVHYLIDPLRDGSVKPYTEVHVFGGDYRGSHGSNGKKISKIMKVMEIANPSRVPDILIGPTFYSRDGSQMSKHRDNGLTLNKLREYFGKEYVQKVIGVTEQINDRRLKVVDYVIVEDMLFR